MALRIKLKNYKAVHSADVELADLTVLAGVNASGKSTIARFFHSIVEINRNYGAKADAVAVVGKGTQNLLAFYSALEKVNISAGELIRWLSDVHFEKANSFEEGYDKVLDMLMSICKNLSENDSIKSDARWLEAFGREVGEAFVSVDQIAEWIREVMVKLKENRTSYMNGSDSNLVYSLGLSAAGLDAYDDNNATISVYDGDSLIFENRQRMEKRNTIYSPACSVYLKADRLSYPITENSSGVVVGQDVYKINPSGYDRADISSRIEKFMNVQLAKLNNASSVDRTWHLSGGSNGDEYKISLTESADGMRSLVPLAILDKYGLLNPNTLLIVDEPESHLHPQWIVQVAEILVALVKERKMRVLVATHSPYLVRALKTKAMLSLKSGQLRYYLANAIDGESHSTRYDYKLLEDDIAPIFKVFNVALDKISFYEG